MTNPATDLVYEPSVALQSEIRELTPRLSWPCEIEESPWLAAHREELEALEALAASRT